MRFASARPQTFLDGGRPLTQLRLALTSAGFELGESRSVRRTLLDTFDGRLADAGLRLEHREGDRSGLVLDDDRSSAAELPGAQPPRFAADLPVGPFRARLGAATAGRALLPQRAVAAMATPVVRRNRDAKTVAAATIYEAPASDGRPTDAVWVVEVDALTGYDSATARLRAVLDDLDLASADGDVFELAGPIVAPGRASASPTIALDPAAPADEGFRAVLLHLAATLQLNLPGTIDDIDSEFLHELRVAVRRTRSVLSHATGVLPADDVAAGRREFAWLGEITGPARDLDVYQLEWADYLRGLAPATSAALEVVRAHLDEQRRDAHVRLAAELRSPRTDELLAWWRGWLSPTAGSAPTITPTMTTTSDHVGRRIRKAHRRLVTGGRAIDADSPTEAVHDLRKDAKRLRYLLECFGGLYGAKSRRAVVDRLKALQDNLGGHQDADVHGRHLRELTAELAGRLPVETVIAAGQLVEQLEQRRAAMRAMFAQRFAEFDSAATRSALRALLATVDR
ncbi:MAG: CHAD domain-containing protein [Ilumatobacteraceae bacterium]